MPSRILCPKCGTILTVLENQCGSVVRCSGCQQAMRVPAPAPPVAASPAAIRTDAVTAKARGVLRAEVVEPPTPQSRPKPRAHPRRKVASGGEFPLVVAAAAFCSLLVVGVVVMAVWYVVTPPVDGVQRPVVGQQADFNRPVEKADVPLKPVLKVLPPPPGEERIHNGDFEQGNKDFGCGYQFSPGRILDEITYDIVPDPRRAHRDAASFGDHTTGRGNMMAVNGGVAEQRTLWSQAVAVRPASDYTFSLWVASWYDFSPAMLDVRINGQSVVKAAAPNRCGEWREFRVSWRAGDHQVATIEIFNLNRGSSGNDFAIDDISLRGPMP